MRLINSYQLSGGQPRTSVCQLLQNLDRLELPGPPWCGSVPTLNSLGDASGMCPSEEESDLAFAAPRPSGLARVIMVLADLGERQHEKYKGGTSGFCPGRPSCHSIGLL